MEIAAFKVKYHNLPVLSFTHSDLNIWSYRSPIDANSIVLDSWLKYLLTLEKSAKNDVKDDNWILPANRFCEETSPNYVSKHLKRHPSFYFNNLAPLSQSLKISCKAIFYFLGK